ncbi:MAG: ABC transporter ATP-binding protein [Patescibacteria group bacterium]|nr:ABC transporter ATP-binding protein [Patescibacteria group bacterium]
MTRLSEAVVYFKTPMSQTAPLIELKNIQKTFVSPGGDYQALKDINLTIRKGEFVAIMGPSGSGKSTIMNIMGALDSPTQGSYKLSGKNISNYTNDQLAEIRNKQIGFIFQSFNLLPRTSVLANVEKPMVYAGIPAKERKKRAMELLELVGIADKANNLANHISGGQIQRVAVARALAMVPSILLADEPTGNLDSQMAYEIMDFIKQLNTKGHTIVLITHEDDIAAYSKRIVRLKDGQIESDKVNK